MSSVRFLLPHPRLRSGLAISAVLLSAAGLLRYTADSNAGDEVLGANPHPVKLVRPADQPLSAAALLGKQIFFDRALSGSGQVSCASCHSPDKAYGPPNGDSVQLGGPAHATQGDRAVPGLRYLYRTPNFSIGPD